MDRERHDKISGIIDDMMANDEAVAAYPNECANCGAEADPFWIPDDYHEKPKDERDPGICTECGYHFGSGEPVS